MDKETLLVEFRGKAEEYIQEVSGNTSDFNKKITEYKNNVIEKIAEKEMTNEERLDTILLITYVSDLIMIEYRNKIWNYDYMAFSRRIGEIWEPFCKLPFYYPVYELQLYDPPKFTYVQTTVKKEIDEYVNNLSISVDEKKELLDYYKKLWNIIEAGENKLELDLHFIQDGVYYDVDYKSGFNSNEKGNVNRLLIVASIYNSLPEEHKNLIFVRQREEDNNNYLQKLKNSSYWDVYCADAAYEKIHEFTGFDLKGWMNENMDWKNDISAEFKSYLIEHDLLKYLTW